jgi:hypothetical protein
MGLLALGKFQLKQILPVDPQDERMIVRIISAAIFVFWLKSNFSFITIIDLVFIDLAELFMQIINPKYNVPYL